MDLQPDPLQSSHPPSSQYSTLLNKKDDHAQDTGWKLSEGWKFALTWGVGVIGIAAAVAFGVWAPMSYKATVESNKNVDMAQSSMMSALTEANSQATMLYQYQSAAVDYQSSAVDYQSSAAKAMESMNSRMVAMGQLALVDFCMKHTNYTPCQSYFETLSIRSLLNFLGATATTNSDQDQTSSTSITNRPLSTMTAGVTTTKPSTSTKTAAQSASAESPPRRGPDPALLGIIFGVIVGVGALLGLLVWVIRGRRRDEKVVVTGT